MVAIMQMKIPRIISRASAAFGDWANVSIWTQSGRREVRRIDVLIAIGFVACTSYYYWSGGWLSALQGAGMYVFVVMVALWVL